MVVVECGMVVACWWLLLLLWLVVWLVLVVVSVLDGGWLSFVGWVDMGLSGG